MHDTSATRIPCAGCPALYPVLPSAFDRFSILGGFVRTRSKSRRSKSQNSSITTSRRPEILPGTIHPEGSQSFVQDQIVSDRALAPAVMDVGAYVLEQFRTYGITEITVFIRIQAGKFEYYGADHDAQTIVWIESQRPVALRGLMETREHNALKEEYWTHMENFPSTWLLRDSSIEELKDVLSSLAIDSGTSDGSTAPFSAEQIKGYLSLLNSFSKRSSHYRTYAAARLWNMVWHARVVNNFGSPDACLDRFVILAEQPEIFQGQGQVWAKLSLGAAETHLERCRRAWAGRVAYVAEWQKFKSNNEQEWKQVTQLACVLLLLSILVSGKHNMWLLKVLPTMVAAGSAADGYYLTNESQNTGNNAADAAAYFQEWERPAYNVQRLALRNATPQALLFWAAILVLLSFVVASLK